MVSIFPSAKGGDGGVNFFHVVHLVSRFTLSRQFFVNPQEPAKSLSSQTNLAYTLYSPYGVYDGKTRMAREPHWTLLYHHGFMYLSVYEHKLVLVAPAM